MQDKRMPLVMRLMGKFGTTPEVSAMNAVTLLTKASAADARGAVLRNARAWAPEQIDWDSAKSTKLWRITTRLAAQGGVALP